VPGATYVSPVDGAVYRYVPAGEFIMGSSDEQVEFGRELCRTYWHQPDDCNGSWIEDEQPQHTVYLDSYWIMETEVTNAQYGKFIEADGYTTETYWSADGWTWRSDNAIVEPRYWEDNRFNNDLQPVVAISWYETEAYANWLSAETGLDFRLPTEAQWEKAARGTDGDVFPWGSQWNSSYANYCEKNCTQDWADQDTDDGYQYTAPVGSYPTGASPYGALDMAGNVWEWTADWYAADYYQNSPARNPQGPSSREVRVLRGGSWLDLPSYLRAAFRDRYFPDNRSSGVGFRLLVVFVPRLPSGL